MLHSLHIGFFPDPLPDIGTPSALAHALDELRFARQGVLEHRWSYVDTHLPARHLDRLFPQVASIADEGTNHRWTDVAKLVLQLFAVQQARLVFTRTAALSSILNCFASK
jgi:hypothetical protein